MRFTVLLSASVIGLSGCASLNSLSKIKPEPTVVTAQQATPIQPKWDETAPEDLPTTDWVGSFSDGTLSSLVSEALEANTNIRAAAARVDAALARADISAADRLPSVNASSRVSRTENAGPFPSSTNLSGGVSANWEADLWGRIKDGVQSSELEAAATTADYAGARLSIAGQVTQSWFDLIEARLLTELSERDVDTQERALRLTQRRFEGGVAGSSDVRLARSSVANSQALQATRRQRLSSVTRRLETLLRRYPAEELQAAADLPSLPPLAGAGTPGYVLRKRPDLLAAERRLQAQGLQIDVARKNLLPRLTLDGSGSLAAGGLNKLFDIDALVGSLIGNLSAPIFQGGRLKANIKQQEAILRQQLENYAGTALDAYLEVENALECCLRRWIRNRWRVRALQYRGHCALKWINRLCLLSHTHRMSSAKAEFCGKF